MITGRNIMGELAQSRPILFGHRLAEAGIRLVDGLLDSSHMLVGHEWNRFGLFTQCGHGSIERCLFRRKQTNGNDPLKILFALGRQFAFHTI